MARVNRRELLAASAAGALLAARGKVPDALARARTGKSLDFAVLEGGKGWPGWRCVGVANLLRSDGQGRLEAGSDVFPCDPRPVAFAVDSRFRDGSVTAAVAEAGSGVGVVARRTEHAHHYAAIVDTEQQALLILRRLGTRLDELGRTSLGAVHSGFRLSLSVSGANPTTLRARVEPELGAPVQLGAEDSAAVLQRSGDPGVLATARTVFPSSGPPALAALGNIHLLPYGVQEGEVIIGSPIGEALLNQIRERSTAVFDSIEIRTRQRPRRTVPSVVAATTGAPTKGGAKLRIATDVPAHVNVAISSDESFRESTRVAAVKTGRFGATIIEPPSLPTGERVYWRATVERRGRRRQGPIRSFRVLPKPGSARETTIAVGACASQFGPIFDQLAKTEPDVFIWQGDLNYPDTVGPLAQTISGYAGIWRDFLANPRIAPILDRAAFAAQRDDHDYGVQDANSTNLKPWGLKPWDALVERRTYYRFSAGLADFWVLDQRLHKSDPDEPDTPTKTLLGKQQRGWLSRTLAESRAPCKVICSPCTLAPLRANARDGSWASGFESERDLILEWIRERVSGQTLFVTGDTHWTLVYDRNGLFEARPCPLGIPTPNDITISDPVAAESARTSPGVAYANDDVGHFALIKIRGSGRVAQLDLSLVREDGQTAYQRAFEEAAPAASRASVGSS